jgi:nascent polypeptide-associated complex subunit alpha
MADTKVEQTTPTQEKEQIVDGDDSDDDLPALEGAENPESGSKGKQSRSEKKTRKALQKLGLKEVTGITKVSVRKGKGVRLRFFGCEFDLRMLTRALRAAKIFLR